MTNDYSKPRDGVRMRFMAYMRVSKDDAITGSHTFVTQELRIRECLDRACGVGNYDLELVRDDGVSGSTALRPTTLEPRVRKSLPGLVEKIASERYDGLIVYAQSRLFRNSRAMMEFIEDVLLKHGTAFLSATEDIDINTSNGRAFLNYSAINDGLYRDTVVKRCRDAAATAKQLGYFIGQVPYGWEWQKKDEVLPGCRRGIVPDPERRAVLLEIREKYLSGWNGVKIAGYLNDAGIAPPSHHPPGTRKGVN